MGTLKETAILIPARMESKRMPGKPMREIKGKPLLHWTYDQAMKVGAAGVFIVSNDPEIVTYCHGNGQIPCLVPTAGVKGYPCGTARCIAATAEWRKSYNNSYRFFVNWQVDEPLISPDDVKDLVQFSDKNIVTLVGPVVDNEGMADEDVVKWLGVYHGKSQWFTRGAIRGKHHIGIYFFPSYQFNNLAPHYKEGVYVSDLAEAESLEQMAWIEWGYTIYGIQIRGDAPPSVNRESDLKRVEELLDV